MISEEERNAIYNIKYLIEKAPLNNKKEIRFDLKSIIAQNIQTVLNLVETQNRMIELMAGSIDNYDSQLEICYFKDRKHIIEVFRNKAKESE